LEGVDEIHASKRKRDILFHVVWYTFELFALYFADGLYYVMAVIASEIVKYDGNSTRKFVIDATVVMGCTSEFSGHVTVVSDSIFS
jgi:hypothetical protein